MVTAGFRPLFARGVRWLILAIAALCATLALPASAQTQPSGKKIALIIGNSNYANGNVLSNPGRDAEAVASAAQQAGFRVFIQKDVTQQNLIAYMRQFRTEADKAEVALVYFAGHGIERDGINYLVPVDARLTDPSDLRVEAVELSYIVDNLRGAERRVILIDACRDNPFKEKWTGTNRSFSNGLGVYNPPDGSLVIFAATNGMVTPDGDAGGNSNFAKALAKRLPEQGLAIQDLGAAIFDDVREASSGRQRPAVMPTLGSAKYYFVPPVDQLADLDSEEIDYFKARQADTAEAYMAYMKKHPNGKNHPTARALWEYKISLGVAAPANPAPGPSPRPAPPAAAPSQPVPQQSFSLPAQTPAPTGPVAPPPQLVQRPASQPAQPAPAAAEPAPPPRLLTRPLTQPAPAEPAPAPLVVARSEPAPVVAPAPQPAPAAPPTQQVVVRSEPQPEFSATQPASSSPQLVTGPAPQPAPVPEPVRVAPRPEPQPPVTAAPQVAIQPEPAPAPAPEPVDYRSSMQSAAPGMFPVMPAAPVFSFAGYPTCKDDWKSKPASIDKANAIVACQNAYKVYKTGPLNGFREKMNNHLRLVHDMYQYQVEPNFPNRAADQQRFYADMLQRDADAGDGGKLMVDYDKANEQYRNDTNYLDDSYNRTVGCKGYPTPSDLAKSTC